VGPSLPKKTVTLITHTINIAMAYITLNTECGTNKAKAKINSKSQLGEVNMRGLLVSELF